MIKLIASDIDGTLIMEGTSTLPEEIFDLIRELQKRGIRFAAASGRQYRGLKRLFAPVADQILYISENGSNIVWKDEELYASVIDPKIVAEMQEYAKHFPEMHLTLSTTKAMHSTGVSDLPYRKLMEEDYQNDMVFDDDEDGSKLKVIKMSLYCRDGIAPYAKEIEEYWKGRLHVVVAGLPWIDFMKPGTDKGTALQFLQEYLKISRAETMAFGDNHNDLGMIQAAGESCAVATARTTVKEAAKYIVGSYDEKGVVKTLQALLEKEKEDGLYGSF